MLVVVHLEWLRFVLNRTVQACGQPQNNGMQQRGRWI
jgi:hypothetical protein